MHNNKASRSFLRSYRRIANLWFCLLVWLVLTAGCATKDHQSFSDQTGNLLVEVKGFSHDRGEAIVSLFSDDAGFPDNMEKAWRSLRLKIESGHARAVFKSVPYGEYALCVLHDEDGDSQMKSRWPGQPLEGFGFSGQPEYRFGPPDFSEVSFVLISETRKIMVLMRYDTVRKETQNERRGAKYDKL